MGVGDEGGGAYFLESFCGVFVECGDFCFIASPAAALLVLFESKALGKALVGSVFRRGHYLCPFEVLLCAFMPLVSLFFFTSTHPRGPFLEVFQAIFPRFHNGVVGRVDVMNLQRLGELLTRKNNRSNQRKEEQRIIGLLSRGCACVREEGRPFLYVNLEHIYSRLLVV